MIASSFFVHATEGSASSSRRHVWERDMDYAKWQIYPERKERPYVLHLAPVERDKVLAVLQDPATPPTKKVRAQILLALDANSGIVPSTPEICEWLDVGQAMVRETAARYRKGGVEIAMRIPTKAQEQAARRRRAKANRRKASPAVEDLVVKLAQSPPPDGEERWTGALLEARVRKDLGQSVGVTMVRRILQENRIRL